MPKLKHEISAHNVKFFLEHEKKNIPVCLWSDIEQRNISMLLGLAETDQDNIKIDEYSISLSFEKVAELADAEAADLNLSELSNVVLHIKHVGVITQQNFKFSYEWYRAGRPLPAVKRIGCFLVISNSYFRMPCQFFKIAEGIDKINSILSEKIDQRLLALKEIKDYLPESTNRSITIDGYLNSTKVIYANALELIPQQLTNDVNFDPILLLHSKINNSTEFESDESSFKPILNPSEHNDFINKFRNHTECQPNYSFGSGKYLIISDDLRKALTIVRKMQHEPLTTKLEFLKNPKAVLVEQGLNEDMIDSIYSDRVSGFGERHVKVIPWIKIEGQKWFPDENAPVGLIIGDQSLSLNSNECLIVKKQLLDALKKGLPSIEYNGITIPAHTETISKVADLVPAKPIDITNSLKNQKNGQGINTDEKRKYVLYVKDNLEDVQYHPRFYPRHEELTYNTSPSILKNSLKEHQELGVKWLVECYQKGVTGVLLADDMGLGKTFQALTYIAWLKENMQQGRIPNRPILIVAPTGLLKNWKQEHDIHLHEPGLGELVQAYGKHLKHLQDRAQTDALVKPLNSLKLKEADWILTTYETLCNHQTSFAGVAYSAVIFDEMQKIKTPNTRITDAAQTLNSDIIIGMTGTPIENRLADLWCLVDTLQPGRLGTLKEFSDKYEKDICEENLTKLKKELTEPTACHAPPFMLRRMKDGTLKDMPKISYHDVVEDMPPTQAKAYMRVLNEAMDKENQERGRQLDAIHKLRSISLHPGEYQSNFTDDSFISESARLKATFRILDEIYKKREKVLIFIEFSKWHQTNFLPAILKRRYGLKRMPTSITGSVNVENRQYNVNLFQEESDSFDVMLLSPRAGGVGLTLTNANHVIHLSRWWNPAVEDQCTDRAYRIGQKKEVHVYYPMAKHPELGEDSFDFNLRSLLDSKRNLSRNLLMPAISLNDEDQLIKNVIFGASSQLKQKSILSFEDIQYMEPLQFENWIINECNNKCINLGFFAQRTQRSWDYKADIIVKNNHGEIVGIIQCKHTQQQIAMSSDPISQLIEARKNYKSTVEPLLIAATNAVDFNDNAKLLATQENIYLLAKSRILNVGEVIKDLFS